MPARGSARWRIQVREQPEEPGEVVGVMPQKDLTVIPLEEKIAQLRGVVENVSGRNAQLRMIEESVRRFDGEAPIRADRVIQGVEVNLGTVLPLYCVKQAAAGASEVIDQQHVVHRTSVAQLSWISAGVGRVARAEGRLAR